MINFKKLLTAKLSKKIETNLNTLIAKQNEIKDMTCVGLEKAAAYLRISDLNPCGNFSEIKAEYVMLGKKFALVHSFETYDANIVRNIKSSLGDIKLGIEKDTVYLYSNYVNLATGSPDSKGKYKVPNLKIDSNNIVSIIEAAEKIPENVDENVKKLLEKEKLVSGNIMVYVFKHYPKDIYSLAVKDKFDETFSDILVRYGKNLRRKTFIEKI